MYEQISMFDQTDDRAPEIITWNLWHGCTRVSTGCKHCYMFRRDEEVGKDPTHVYKTKSFDVPIEKYKKSGLYKIPSGSLIYTCFSSDFFHPDADTWRADAWAIMKERADCTFEMLTKRPERIRNALPTDWVQYADGSPAPLSAIVDGTKVRYGYPNVHIGVTCEDQYWTDQRLPVYLSTPLPHYSITHEPMLSQINIKPYLGSPLWQRKTASGEMKSIIESVTCGGESGPDARTCDFGWVVNSHLQCVEYGVQFYYHQTGAKLIRGSKLYTIARELQHSQAQKAGLDYMPPES